MRRAPTLTAVAVVLAGTAAAAIATGSAEVAATAAPAAPAVTTAAASAPGAYVPVTPTRALDTRVTGGGGALAAGQTRTLDLAARVPSSTAVAVVLNLTVAAPKATGYVTVFPAGTSRPTASSINFRAGEIRSNSVTVALPASRALSIYNFVGSTQVVVDLLGWYDSGTVANSATYVPAPTPYRQLDTREGNRRLAAGQSVDVTIPPGEDRVADATALALNVTAVSPSGQGYLTAWSGQGSAPSVSTVNYGTDPVTPNFAVVPVQVTDGTYRFRVTNSVAATDVLVDVLGYYVTGGGGDLYRAVAPLRIVDTRTSDGGPSLGPNATRPVVTTAAPGAQAFNVNVTAVGATQGTFLTVYGYRTADGGRPAVSALNPFSPAALANAVQTRVQTGGDQSLSSFSVYNLAGMVDVVVDLQGWFVPSG